MALLQMYEKKMQRLSRIKTRKKSQRAGNQMEIKSQGGFQGICGSELKVRYQPALRVCVWRARETREAFSLDLAMPNPISLWLLPGNITLTGREEG